MFSLSRAKSLANELGEKTLNESPSTTQSDSCALRPQLIQRTHFPKEKRHKPHIRFLKTFQVQHIATNYDVPLQVGQSRKVNSTSLQFTITQEMDITSSKQNIKR